MATDSAPNRILTTMLDRLYAAIVSGPSINCRPNASRQRIDLFTFERLADLTAEQALAELLSDRAAVTIAAKVAAPPPRASRPKPFTSTARSEKTTPDAETADEPKELQQQRRAHTEQQALLLRLRILAEEAQTYQQDTGAHVLYVGYPLLSIPSGGSPAVARSGNRQILAPLAFIPVDLAVRTNLSGGVEIRCREDEVDRVIPNESLLAWVERQTGREMPGLFNDSEGKDPWREIRSICQYVASALELKLPEFLSTDAPAGSPHAQAVRVQRVPATDDRGGPAILPCAVLGLFPASKQGLLRDTKAMIASPELLGPVGRFLNVLPNGAAAPQQQPAAPLAILPPAQRRLVTRADPCQARAVALARQADALVIHGPPGTGKSQTITNIIADHLARGERVLFVCDKRTALDVVANRLAHLGLGSLCALVHDAQRDQRDLYRSIRDQIENLTDTQIPAAAARQLESADTEITRIHTELTNLRTALMLSAPDGSDSVHHLVGQWLQATLACITRTPRLRTLDATLLRGATLAGFEASTIDLQSLLRHAASCAYFDNPWSSAAGIALPAFLAMPMADVRTKLTAATTTAATADSAAHPSIPPFLPAEPIAVQAQQRQRLLDALTGTLKQSELDNTRAWLSKDPAAVGRASKSLAEIAPHIQRVRDATLDPELHLLLRQAPPTVASITESIAALEDYLTTARSWHAFVHFGKGGAAKRALTPLGLPLSAASAERAVTFFTVIRSSLIVRSVLDQFAGRTSSGLPDPAEVASSAAAHSDVIALVQLLKDTPALRPLRDAVERLLNQKAASPGPDPVLIDGLHRSGPRAKAIADLETTLSASGLFSQNFLDTFTTAVRSGSPASEPIAALADRVSTIESVLRVRDGLKSLPEAIRPAVEQLLSDPVDVDAAMLVLRQAVLAAETRARIEASPEVATLDPHRIQSLFDRWRDLDHHKHTLVRNSVLAHWVGRQRGRLLAMTGSRLNADGAELRRRVSSRGVHSLRLRQVLELGRSVAGGDPLLDLRPVWMASPETVAQIFPLENTFDIVVFDEASQCRLEEALPVIMRAKRVVIAGDPKQLPPSRFFEDSSVTESTGDDIETDQDLFEQQQSDVEDLLSASLNLDLQQTYLDVHYRSRNADLIAFSNEQFYGSRLQPIPGHPANRTRYAPLTLYNVGGVYEERTNPTEADQVVRIIRDLLRRANPPSIGVGCFNIAQRDLIVERLDDAATADPGFAAALAAARTRTGEGSFEGLFVKNLENVQGDERDHIIISTTYGPDATGKFYRRFGPLAMPGGGRRLNVLVTRARCEVHLVSSIPPAMYRSLPPVEPGQVPGGGWLLFSYLNYAERLAVLYEAAHARHRTGEDAADTAASTSASSGAAADAAPQNAPEPHVDADGDSHSSEHGDDAPESEPDTNEAQEEFGRGLRLAQVKNPSLLAITLGDALVRHTASGGTVHWGNEGFCVDIALDHPTRPDDVTIGVLTDFSRFDLAGDHIEWDGFSATILRDQGWALQRTWSPSLFRDLQGNLDTLAAQSTAEAAKPRREML